MTSFSGTPASLVVLESAHAALWWLADDTRIGDEVTRHLTGDTNQVLLSAVVVWEVAIKRSLGKLDAPEDLARPLLAAGAQALPVTTDAAAPEKLPRHHRDPFDRLLIAQALTQDARSCGARGQPLSEYGVTVVW